MVHRVPERGGASAPVTTLDASRGENAHYWPVALPGGRKFLFFIRSTRPENNGIYLGSLDGTKPVRLVTSLSSGLYAPARGDRPGHLLWVRDDDLFAQPLDIDSGRLTGEVKSVASDVRVEESQRGTFASVSDAGRLVWASARGGDFNFSWYERNGHRLGDLPIATGKIMQPRISPDGRKLAFTRAVGGTADIWVHDLASAATTQVTTDPDYDENPFWSPDGRRLVYQGRPEDTLMVATLDGSSPILKVPGGSQLTGGGFMPDGSTILFSRLTASTTNDLAVAHLDRPDAIVALTNEPGQELLPTPSPDGRWLAFVTDRTGRPEVVIARLFSDGTTFRLGQRLPVSAGGGIDPTWRKDGREIVYLAPDATLMSVAVTVDGEAVTLGKPTPLFKVPADAGGWGSNWAATADLSKFVVRRGAARQRAALPTADGLDGGEITSGVSQLRGFRLPAHRSRKSSLLRRDDAERELSRGPCPAGHRLDNQTVIARGEIAWKRNAVDVPRRLRVIGGGVRRLLELTGFAPRADERRGHRQRRRSGFRRNADRTSAAIAVFGGTSRAAYGVRATTSDICFAFTAAPGVGETSDRPPSASSLSNFGTVTSVKTLPCVLFAPTAATRT